MIIIESYFGRNLLSLAPFPLRHSAIDGKSECRWHNFLLLAQKVSSDGKIGSVTSPICSMEREYLGSNLLTLHLVLGLSFRVELPDLVTSANFGSSRVGPSGPQARPVPLCLHAT